MSLQPERVSDGIGKFCGAVRRKRAIRFVGVRKPVRYPKSALIARRLRVQVLPCLRKIDETGKAFLAEGNIKTIMGVILIVKLLLEGIGANLSWMIGAVLRFRRGPGSETRSAAPQSQHDDHHDKDRRRGLYRYLPVGSRFGHLLCVQPHGYQSSDRANDTDECGDNKRRNGDYDFRKL
jgi:hypothetical protein